jgi:predicted DCC family thiol-disulfide oxidoreductase YuxK
MSEAIERGRAPATLRYDSSCAFCSASARWVEIRGAGRVRLEAAPGIRAAELEGDGVGLRRGGAALTEAYLLATGQGWLRFLDWPGVRLLRDAAYAVVARSRHVLSRLLWR